VPKPDETRAEFIERFSREMKRHEGSILMVMAYGSVTAHDAVMEQLSSELGGSDWPLLWVEGASCHGGALAGFQVFILPEGKIERVRLDGRVVASVFHDGGARHCLLAGLMPGDAAASRADQTRQVLESAEAALRQAGFTYGDLARTWFYNDDILSWYDDFNRARTKFYLSQRFVSGSSPASTAVRGCNPRHGALAFGAWAVVPSQAGAAVRELVSPLQCPAPAYGSSFSRAMEIVSAGRRRVVVSGTASIEPGGKTVWVGDARKQIDLTMEVVAAILKSRGLGFSDVTRATAYFKHAADVAHFEAWCAEHGLSNMPVVPVHCDICRGDLLFEIELDACAAV
jgi:enamine deaminase RidA (YjgF/YER057c/UK114 family)